MPRLAIALAAQDRGSTATEYAVIAGLVSVLIIAALRVIGLQVSVNFFGPLAAALGG